MLQKFENGKEADVETCILVYPTLTLRKQFCTFEYSYLYLFEIEMLYLGGSPLLSFPTVLKHN